MVELEQDHPIFVGFKLATSLRRQVEALTGSDSKYVSDRDSPDFLSLCRMADKLYVGKLVRERLTTDRVDDVRRNVLSIMRRLFPEERLPEKLEILVSLSPSVGATPFGDGER